MSALAENLFMKRLQLIIAALLTASSLLFSSCDGSVSKRVATNPAEVPSKSPSSTSAATATVTLPLEVIGPDGYTETAEFTLNDTSSIDRLFVQCHRCGYRDASVNPQRGAKASVRLNGGAWVNLDDKTAIVSEPAKGFGGIAGGFNTVALTVPIKGAINGTNKLEFRFNKTDGFTSGYRILKFNLQRGAENVVPDTAFKEDTPSDWQAPLTSPTDISKGRDLWNSAALKESPLSNRELKAACTSCHAADGRDLKYFNYSNWSIQERAKFHGLSELEGKQIASYIRTLNVPAPAQARPWNPPYQPGPGLDSKPVTEWAAGAGVDAVLQSDKDLLSYLFTGGTGQEAINQTASIKGTLNMRELPVSIQLPDWNDWLPETHPLDVWGDAFAGSDATKAYKEVKDAFQNGQVKDRAMIDQIESLLTRSWKATFPFMGGPVPCPTYRDAIKNKEPITPTLIDQLHTGKTCEDGLQATNHWLAVKNWELFQTYKLEDVTPKLYPYGEKRGWIGHERNVFEVAAHRSADNSGNFKHQSLALGSYHSNAWYHLQLVLNAGNRDPYTFFPQDWFYTPMFIALNSRDNRQPLALMNTAMHIKMYQNLDMKGPDGQGADRGFGYDGWYLPFVNVWRFESTIGWEEPAKWKDSISADGKTSTGFPWTYLDNYESGLRVKVTNALLRQFLAKTKSYPVDKIARRTNPNDGLYFEPADYIVPNDKNPELACFYSCPGQSFQARDTYRALLRFREMGVDAQLRNELIDWMKQLFPNPKNDWDALR
jgi:cytochrome c553